MRHEGMLTVRADLLGRIDALAAGYGRARLAWLVQEIAAIRHIALRHGLEPLERLAGIAEGALGYPGHSTIILSYLKLMRDAAGCAEVEPAAAQTIIATLPPQIGA